VAEGAPTELQHLIALVEQRLEGHEHGLLALPRSR
jgi:hypothetical protein